MGRRPGRNVRPDQPGRADPALCAPAGRGLVRADRARDAGNPGRNDKQGRERSWRALYRPCFDLRQAGGEGGIRTLERGYPRYAISSRARSTAPAPLQRIGSLLQAARPIGRSAAAAMKATTHAPAAPGMARFRWPSTDARGRPALGSAALRRPALVGSRAMVLAEINRALFTDIGLIATFGGIGVVVNVIIVYIAVQIRGERLQNQEYREQLLDQ